MPLLAFTKGQRKDDVMAEHLARFEGEEGVLFVGKAQEKTAVVRTERWRTPETGEAYPWLVRSTAMANHYSFYAGDRDVGPFFLKFCAYFPDDAKLCLNGHEDVKRQLAQRGIRFTTLDNGLLACAEPGRLQTLYDGLSAARWRRCSAGGGRGCRIPSRPAITAPATAISSRSGKPNSA